VPNYVQIPLDRPDQTLEETKSDRVCSGVRQVRGLCLVVDVSVQSRHVQILSMGLVGSQTKSVGPCRGIWKRHDHTNDIFSYLVSIYLFISHVLAVLDFQFFTESERLNHA